MADEFDLRPFDHEGEDRLPWLETVEPDEPPAQPWGKIAGGILIAAIVAALLFLGIRTFNGRQIAGNGDLIAAQEGDYKVKPDDPGGLKVSGEGNSAIATSAGKGAGNGAIDLKAVPERPVVGKPAATHPAAAATPAGRIAVAQVPARGGRLVAAAPGAVMHATANAGVAGGSLVQLGAFPSEAAANAAWASYSRRFGYVAALGKSVQPVAVNGKTLYRLRVNAGSANQAADICGRLKVAGEACFIAS